MAKITVYDVTTGEPLQMRAVDAIVARRRGQVRFKKPVPIPLNAEPDAPKRRTYKRRDMQPEQTEELIATPSDDAA